jgi:hypothetical protein
VKRRPSRERVGQVVRACGFALATAEFALAGRVRPEVALDAIARELDRALEAIGVELGELARAHARAPNARFDH